MRFRKRQLPESGISVDELDRNTSQLYHLKYRQLSSSFVGMSKKKHAAFRPLINAAVLTSPVIAALLVTPLFLASGMTAISLQRVLLLMSGNVLFTWALHLTVLKLFPKLSWQRLILSIVAG